LTRIIARPAIGPSLYGDPSRIIDEFHLDDEKAIEVGPNQSEVPKALHKQMILGQVVRGISGNSSKIHPGLIPGTTLLLPVNLRLLGSDHHQHDPADKRQSAQQWRERDGLLGVGGRLDGADIDNLLAAGVGDTLVGKSHYSQHDESDPHNRYRIDAHTNSSFF
jgi:hypothetical protein